MSLATLKVLFIVCCFVAVAAFWFSSTQRAASKATYTLLTPFETYTGMTKKFSNIYVHHNGLEVFVSGNYVVEEEPYVRGNR